MTHTELPWMADNRVDSAGHEIGGVVAEDQFVVWHGKYTSHANAEFIVRACNSHDVLVEALENVLVEVRVARVKAHPHNPIEELRLLSIINASAAALAAARGGKA